MVNLKKNRKKQKSKGIIGGMSVLTLLFFTLLPPSIYSAERGESLFKKYGFHDIDAEHSFEKIDTGSNQQQKPNLRRIADLGESQDKIDSDISGKWDYIDSRYILWRVKLTSEKSIWMDTQFKTMKIPAGTTILVSNPVTQQGWRYSSEELQDMSQLRTAAVSGNTLLIEAKVPVKLRDRFYLEIGRSLLGFDWLGPSGTTNSGPCNVDAICEVGPTAKSDNMRSVAHYTFETTEGAYVCSGAILASSGHPYTPYFLTAHHCISTPEEAATVNLYWNYQSPECRVAGSADNGTPLSIDFASHNQYGAQLTATYEPTDFTLLTLDDLPPSGANTFYAGWQNMSSINERSSLNGTIHSIHHPAGHEKRISVVTGGTIERSGYYENAGIGDTHWRVNNWDIGTTEGGSSGAPLFLNRWIVGQLHGGDAACGNSEPDWYGAFSRSYRGGETHETQLKWWLQNGDITGPEPGMSKIIIQLNGHEGP